MTTGSSMTCAVATRSRTRSAPAGSTMTRAGTRRSPDMTSAVTHSAVTVSPASVRTWTTKSSVCPSIVVLEAEPKPAADASTETTVNAAANKGDNGRVRVGIRSTAKRRAGTAGREKSPGTLA
ncbi:MAG: hypothetical protein U1F67_13630 [Rubrivivax sp.]